MQRWLAKLREALKRVEQDRAALAFLAAFAFVSLLYRVVLSHKLYSAGTPPFGFLPLKVPWWQVWRHFGADLLLGVVMAMMYCWLKGILSRRLKQNPGETPRGIQAAEMAVGDLLLLAIALITFSHYHLIFELESGLTVSLFYVFATQFALGDFFKMLSPTDMTGILAPVVVFHLAAWMYSWWRRALKPRLVQVVMVLVFLDLVLPRAVSPELAEPPLQYFARDWLRAPVRMYSGRNSEYKQSRDLPGEAQRKSIRLVDDAFVSATPLPSELAGWRPDPSVQTNDWNVMFFVMESVGTAYIFDTAEGNEVPMPFLKRKSESGIYLSSHRSVSNTSPQSLFSIFTGLYPRPNRIIFSMLKDVSIPTMNRFLGAQYHSFLVHPSSPTYFFPRHMFLNNGITNMYDLSNIPAGPNADKTKLARNELDSVDFTLKLLDRTPEPFFGIYWSFIPHHPYDDYGEEYRVLPLSKKKRHMYYNNLRTLDALLERICGHLEKTGRLERTILVFVGDHGEGMGLHPGAWGHSFGTFDETYRTPCIIYQPRLVPAHTITQPTSHVDIMPTVLDLMGRQWNENVVQGESLLRPMRRRYIFSMDAMSEYMSVIDHRWNKVSIAYETGLAFGYNLERDPGEKFLLEADHFGDQVKAILKFRNYQAPLIEDYNTAVREGKEFLGERPWPEYPAPHRPQ